MTSTTSKSVHGAPVDLIGGHYRVVRTIGKGGMGTVYEAENTWTQRRVAVKVMRPEVARDGELASRFMQEARATSRLAHPNIIDVLDMGQDQELGALYIVEEYLTGHDLRVHLNLVGRMSPRDALDIILPVMEALSEAHAHGIVHRDLKPDNIFLAETSRGIVPTLIDFGVAKIVAGEADGMGLQTRVGMLMGTPSYMAPEQGRGDVTVDGRADIWSIGVVLYEMLAGRRPHDALTAPGLIAQIIYQDPIPLDRVAPELPADLVAAVMGALQRDLSKRYPSMRDFEDALRHCELLRVVPSAVTSTSPPRPLPEPIASETPPPKRSAARVGWVALVAVLGVGVALLSAALIHGTNGTDRPSRPAATATVVPRPAIPPPTPPQPLIIEPTPPQPAAPVTVAPVTAATPRRAPVRVVRPRVVRPARPVEPEAEEPAETSAIPVIE
jgi:serine/threonine-protein kinase